MKPLNHGPLPSESQPPSLLGTPGEILANVPGILGFYPEESLVLATFFRKGDTAHHTLGPVLRVDLDDVDLLPDIATALEPVEPDLIFAFIITADSSSIHVDLMAERLFEAGEQERIGVTACWITTGIFSGEPYHLAFGPAPGKLTYQGAELPGWTEGRIPPVVQAAATRKMLEAGQLPEPNRTEAYSHFRRGNPNAGAREIMQMQNRSLLRSGEIMRALERANDGRAYRSTLSFFADLLDQADPDSSPAGQSLLADVWMLSDVASYLHTALLRDSVIHLCVERPHAAMELLLATARTFDGVVRSNALCLYALSALSVGLPARAVTAVTTALEVSPGHSLSTLLCQGLREGRGRTMVAACLRGSEVLRGQRGAGPEATGPDDLVEDIPTPDAA